jgi:hypothetical protein
MASKCIKYQCKFNDIIYSITADSTDSTDRLCFQNKKRVCLHTVITDYLRLQSSDCCESKTAIIKVVQANFFLEVLIGSH